MLIPLSVPSKLPQLPMTPMLRVLRVPPDQEDHLFPNLPDLDPRSVPLPTPDRLAHWRKTANVRSDAALAEFDAALLAGDDARLAARKAIDEVTTWVRSTARDLATHEGTEIVRGTTRQRAAEAWQIRSEAVVDRAVDDPDAVDRHLRLYVGMAYEAAARGYAAIVASVV